MDSTVTMVNNKVLYTWKWLRVDLSVLTAHTHKWTLWGGGLIILMWIIIL